MWEEKGEEVEGDTWWWNEEVKEAISRKKDAHKAMCHNNTEMNKRKLKALNNKAKNFKRNVHICNKSNESDG